MNSKSLLLLATIVLALLVHISICQVNIAKHMVEFDEDEFEGVEPMNIINEELEQQYEEQVYEEENTESGSSATTSDTAANASQESKESASAVKKQNNWFMEISFVAFIIGYGINYFVGKKTNQELVTIWGRRFRPLFESNFTYLGDKQSYVIIKVDPNTYVFTCSGRVNCQGAQVTLTLKKRQDLFHVIMDLVGYADPDRISIEIALNSDVMEPMIFAVIKNKSFKKFKSDNNDVSLFCSKQALPYGLNSTYAVLSDTECLPTLLLKPEIAATLNSHENFFESMHFTDHSLINPKYPKTLSFSYKLPSVKDMDKIQPLTSMALQYIDYIANVKLPPQYKAKAEKLRAKEREELFKQQHLERQEQAQKKKFEKEQKEKEKIAKLTPEEQRKRDDKEYKALLKKRQAKGKIVVG
ncbi:hypothetical protein SAMD00019534_069840 [Acytostelium subglobosum LB1]|uniref:hypothetical protein n=1 Tax=Acytostelium subglobosum LB1 TaxID=1410327 RepID=UPI0006449949|nr:hypothetical protein SAMD00019534_069840 [Acytostelium subglobosum LB1]GAM23809.1 hypothetical protein SAMD00019534_069840 [Acytostelium subglobosum LB1]|eukprot:XP_012753550.1 hypothetical protein SAMD00019534_069840 [Acytostelium subglobosum LB1]